jgi:hypothetical protein
MSGERPAMPDERPAMPGERSAMSDETKVVSYFLLPTPVGVKRGPYKKEISK